MHSGAKFLFVILLLASVASLAQEERERLQAVAFGTATQLGQTFTVNFIIESYSTPEDQQVLLQAFNQGGSEAMAKVLEKMSVKGRINTPRQLGYEIRYARVWPTPTGRKIRLVTNRTIALGEVSRNTRSREYSVSVVEIELNNADGDKSTGTLLPACKLKMNKEGQIEMEAYQNPWRLGNITRWK